MPLSAQATLVEAPSRRARLALALALYLAVAAGAAAEVPAGFEVRPGDSQTTIEFIPPPFELDPGNGQHPFAPYRLGAASLRPSVAAGHPELPGRRFLVALPPTATARLVGTALAAGTFTGLVLVLIAGRGFVFQGFIRRFGTCFLLAALVLLTALTSAAMLSTILSALLRAIATVLIRTVLFAVATVLI